MEIEKAKKLVTACFSDPVIKRLYDAGDHLSKNQTKHDLAHAQQVRDLAVKIAREIEDRKPGYLDAWTLEVIIPLAAFLHDIGRAINVEDHDKAGAKWAQGYLKEFHLPDDSETLPPETVKRICRIIACHRSRIVLKQKFDDPAWALVVLADKCVGDEERVRPQRAAILTVLTWLRLSWIPLRKGGVHDRANFAIKKADLIVDEADLVLSLQMDRRVCKPSLIYKLYGERFWACGKAAQYLGFRFRLEFNGERYSFCKEKETWVPVKCFSLNCH